jgi:hypothetical protein
MSTSRCVNQISKLGTYFRSLLNALFGVLILSLPFAAVAAPGGGDYAKEQAQAGAQTYSASLSRSTWTQERSPGSTRPNSR